MSNTREETKGVGWGPHNGELGAWVGLRIWGAPGWGHLQGRAECHPPDSLPLTSKRPSGPFKASLAPSPSHRLAFLGGEGRCLLEGRIFMTSSTWLFYTDEGDTRSPTPAEHSKAKCGSGKSEPGKVGTERPPVAACRLS